MITDTWFTISKIDADTYAISEPGHWERCISYLALGTRSAALIDTGLGIGNIRRLTDSLTELPVKVLTTHVHWDHIGGHGLYDEIYVHEAEKAWLVEGVPLPLSQIRSDLIREPLTKPIPPQFAPDSYTPFTGQPTGLLQDGDVIDLGGRQLLALHTPGHSPGHLCFLDTARGYLFTGDLLYQGTLYAFYPSTDPVAYAASIARLAELPGIKKLLPAHNDLDIPVDLLAQANRAFKRLQEQELLHHGSGLHSCGPLQIKL